MKKQVLSFDDFRRMNSSSVNESLENLKKSQDIIIKTMKSSDAEKGEIQSIESGFTAISKALNAKPEDIVCLIDYQNEPIIVGHPDLADDEAYTFSSFHKKINKCPSKQIWIDEFWKNSPGSNQIDVYECPAKDGGIVKVAVWSGSNWDYSKPYILASDIKRHLKI